MRTVILVISLESSIARREAFADHASQQNREVSWQFFPAHTHLSNDLTYVVEDAKIAKGRPLHQRELACYSSHYGVWKKVYNEGAEQVIILEDDVVLDWDFVALLAQCDLSVLDIHYLKLFNKNITPIKALSDDFYGRWLVDCRGYAYGMQAYMLTRAGAKHMLEACQRVRRPIDDEIDRSWAHGIPNLAVFPFPAFERYGPSTIGTVRHEAERLSASFIIRKDLMRVAEKFRRLKQKFTGYGLRKSLPPTVPEAHL